jgi:hypothetical protein
MCLEIRKWSTTKRALGASLGSHAGQLSETIDSRVPGCNGLRGGFPP